MNIKRRRSNMLTLVALASAALLAVGPAAVAQDAGQRRVGPNTMVNPAAGPTRTLEYPAVAVNPNNTRQLVMGVVDPANARCLAFRSDNGGLTWVEAAPPDAGARCDLTNHNFFPTQWGIDLEYEADGTVYYAFSARRENSDGTSRSVYLARSSDNGRSWTTSTVYQAAPGQREQGDVNVRPDIALAPNTDDVYVSWRHPFAKSTERPSELRVAASRDGGRTFGDPVALDRPGDVASIVATSDAVYAFYPSQPPAGASDAPPERTPIVMSKSTDGGRTWRTTEIEEGAAEVSPTRATVLPGGDLVVVWDDNRVAEPGTVARQVWALRSTDDGATWSEPIRVSPNTAGALPSENVNQLYPVADVAPGGRLDVVWYDYRNDPFPVPEDADSGYLGKAADVFAASSTDGGRTFEPAVRVTDRTIDRRLGTWQDQYFLNAHPSVASMGSSFGVAWSDTRHGTPDTGTQDIFFAPVAREGTAGGLTAVEDGAGTGRLVLFAAALVIGGAGLALIAGAFVMRGRGRPAGRAAG